MTDRTEPRNFMADDNAFRQGQFARCRRLPLDPISAYPDSERLQAKWAEGWLSIYRAEERRGDV